MVMCQVLASTVSVSVPKSFGRSFLFNINDQGFTFLLQSWVPFVFSPPAVVLLSVGACLRFKGRGAVGGERGHRRTRGSSPPACPALSGKCCSLATEAGRTRKCPWHGQRGSEQQAPEGPNEWP